MKQNVNTDRCWEIDAFICSKKQKRAQNQLCRANAFCGKYITNLKKRKAHIEIILLHTTVRLYDISGKSF